MILCQLYKSFFLPKSTCIAEWHIIETISSSFKQNYAIWRWFLILLMEIVQIIYYRVHTGFGNFGKVLEFWNLNSRPWKSMEFGVWVWKSFGLLEIHCQMAHTVQYTYDLVGWPWEIWGLFCPVRSVLEWEWVLEKQKVLERFWDLARQNLCKPWD